MKKIILSEESFGVIKNRVDEISDGMIDDAYDRSDNLFQKVRYSFEGFRDVLNEVIDGEQKSNPYLNRIKELADEIEDILIMKKKQQKKFFNATN